MAEIIVLEDCIDNQILVDEALKGHSLTFCSTIVAFRELTAKKNADLYLIDVNLPDGNGVNLCEELMHSPVHQNIPKIILSADDSIASKIYGFSCGISDYIAKPFNKLELKARIDSKISLSDTRDTLVKYGFIFNKNLLTVSYQDEISLIELDLTPTEYRCLLLLVQNKDRLLSRFDVVRGIWRTAGTNIEQRGVDAHISNIRKKILNTNFRIISKYGLGYIFAKK